MSNTKTLDMLKVLFTGSSLKELEEVASIITTHGSKFGVNTPLRVAHFLAQVREEIGSKFEPKVENLNYSEESLIKTFKVFKDKPELADMYGRDEDTPKANQEAIANLAYANRMGNGNADSDGDGDMDKDDDGFRYRGAGCLQITGKSNFEEVQKRCVRYAGKEMNPDTLEGFVVFGMAYWIQHDLYKLADRGKSGSVVDSITAKINYHTHSYANRVVNFGKIVSLIER